MRTRHCWVTIGCGMLALAALPALAALGDNVASVAADRAHLHGQLKGVTASTGFTVQEIDELTGTVVREYVSPNGTVFAVSWTGPSIPDLRQIFGSYFQQYLSASSRARHGAAARRHFEVTQPDLIVQSSGHMRAFHGRAYVPSLIPSGITPGDIR